MNPRSLILLIVVIFILTCRAFSTTALVELLKTNTTPAVGFAYLNKSNKLVSFKPVDQISLLDNGQLYVVFPVYFYQGYVKNPDKKILRIKVFFTNGTVITKDLSSDISSSGDSDVVFKYSDNKTIKYMGPDNLYYIDTVSIYTLALKVKVFPFLVNLSGKVKRIEINMTIKNGEKFTINIIKLTFGNNLPLIKKFYEGSVENLQMITPNMIENKLTVSLPNVTFVKITNDNLRDLVVIGANTSSSKFNMTNIIFSSSIASFVRIGSSIYLMLEPTTKIKKTLKFYGYGFLAFCSDSGNSGFYYVSMDYINNLNTMLCNPTYLTPTNINISFNFAWVDNFIKHNKEKEAPIHIRKFLLVSPNLCITSNWFAIVLAKTLIKSNPYLYFKYVSPDGLQDYSGVLDTGLTAYRNFIESDIKGIDSSGKEVMLNALMKFEKNKYGYLYSKIVKIKPSYLIKHGDQCIMIFEYNYTLFGIKPSQVSITLININGTTKTEFKKALKLDNIIWSASVKQKLTGIIEGLGTLTQYVYHVSIMPYPTSPNNKLLYVFKFTPTIKLTTYLFTMSLIPIVLGTIGALSLVLGGTVITTQLLSWYERVINSARETVTSLANEMYNSLYYSISQDLITTGDPDLEALGFLLNARKTYALLFSPSEDSVAAKLFKFYNILKENENIRNKFFNLLKSELESDSNFASKFQEAFPDWVYNKIMSGEYSDALDGLFNVNSNLGVAKLNVENAITNYEDEKIVKEGFENVMEKMMEENPDIKDLLTSEFKAPDFVMSDGFAMSNEITRVLKTTSESITEFNEMFETATEEAYPNLIKGIVADSMDYLVDVISTEETASESGGVLKVLFYTLKKLSGSSKYSKYINEFKTGIRELAKELRETDVESIDDFADVCSIRKLFSIIVEKYSLDSVGELKPLFKVLYSISRSINIGTDEILSGKTIADKDADELAKAVIDEGDEFSNTIFKLFKIKKITKISNALEKIEDIFGGVGVGRLVLSGLYIIGAATWFASVVETIGAYLKMVRFAQQIYSHSINNSSGYLPLVLVNFEGRSFPVPIPINKSLIQPVKFDKVNIWYCNILGTNIKTFGGLYVGNASTVTSINQYLPPVGLLPDFYSENPMKDTIYKLETAGLAISQGTMGVANALALVQLQLSRTAVSSAIETAAETAVETAAEEAMAEGATLLGLDFIGIVGGPIGIAASLAIMVGMLWNACHSLKFLPYHQFLKLLGVETFTIVNPLLSLKAQKLGITINPNRLVIEFYMNNSSFEKLLKQICIYGYLGKWNSTSHICFAGALFNNTPYLSYVDNNSSFYYGPIPSRVLLDSGDVYVGILSLPITLSERIDDHEYTYSNKELFELLNAIWSYFKKPNHPNLGLFINWVEENPNLDKNYGLMAILAAKQKDKYNIMAYLIAGACLGYVVQDFGINNNQNIDKAVCENFVSKCLPSYVEILNNLTTIKEKGKYAPLLSGNPTSPIATTNNTKIEFSNNISVRAFNSTDYIVYAPLIVLYARMTKKDKVSKIKLTMETEPTYTIKFPVYEKTVSIYLDVIGQDSKGYFHSVASDLYNDPSSPIPKSKFKLITIDGQKVPVLPVVIYNITNTSIYNFNFPLQYLYYIGKENNFNINVTKQIEYLVVGHNKYYGIFKTIFNTKDVLTNQGIPDYWPKESQTAPVIKPRPNFIRVVSSSIGQAIKNILSADHNYYCLYTNSYIYASAVANCLASKLPNVVVNEMINKGKFGFSTNVLAYIDKNNNKIVLLAMKGVVGTNTPTFWEKWSMVQPEKKFYDMKPVEKSSGLCLGPISINCHKVFGPPSLGLTDKPYEFQGYFEVQVLVPKTELSEMLTYCSSKYKNCKIALIAIPS